MLVVTMNVELHFQQIKYCVIKKKIVQMGRKLNWIVSIQMDLQLIGQMLIMMLMFCTSLYHKKLGKLERE